MFLGELDARIHAGEKVVEGKLPGMWPKKIATVAGRAARGRRADREPRGDSRARVTRPGHVAFLDTRDQTLIAGDVYTSYGMVAVSTHFYWRFPLAYGATWDKPTDIESARRLRALEPKLLVGRSRTGDAGSGAGNGSAHRARRGESVA